MKRTMYRASWVDDCGADSFTVEQLAHELKHGHWPQDALAEFSNEGIRITWEEMETDLEYEARLANERVRAEKTKADQLKRKDENILKLKAEQARIARELADLEKL